MYAKFENDRKKLILSVFWHISNIISLYLETDAINQKMLLNKKFLEFDFVYVFSEGSDEIFKVLVTEGQTDKVSNRGASLLKSDLQILK